MLQSSKIVPLISTLFPSHEKDIFPCKVIVRTHRVPFGEVNSNASIKPNQASNFVGISQEIPIPSTNNQCQSSNPYLSPEEIEYILLNQDMTENMHDGLYCSELGEIPSSTVDAIEINKHSLPSEIDSYLIAQNETQRCAFHPANDMNGLKDLESILFSAQKPDVSETNVESHPLKNDAFLMSSDPFWGDFNPHSKPYYPMNRPNSILKVHELMDRSTKLPVESVKRNQLFHVKVITKFKEIKPDPNETSRPLEYKNRFVEERKEYNMFIRKLMTGETRGECDDEEDEIFDSMEAQLDEDMASDVGQSLQAIPRHELLELFEDDWQSEPSNLNSIRRTKKDKLNGSPTISQKFEQAMAGNHTEIKGLRDRWAEMNSPAKYCQDFFITLERQMNIHFQLSFQTLALAAEIDGANQVWITMLKMMMRFVDYFSLFSSNYHTMKLVGIDGMAQLLQTLGKSPIHLDLLKKIKPNNNDPDLRLRAFVAGPPNCYKPIKIGSFSKTFCNILSIFGKPFDSEFSLTFNDPNHPDAQDLIDNQTSPISKVRKFAYGKRNDCFLPIEDHLLLLGLHRFGFCNWERIQVHLIPTRSAKQLSTRYKNLTTRRAPQNKVKDFFLEALKPLSMAEEELLLQGVRMYGEDFINISSHFLPQKPPTILLRKWQQRVSWSSNISSCNTFTQAGSIMKTSTRKITQKANNIKNA